MGHQLSSEYLQNKQGKGGGVPAASPMPKSDRENVESKRVSFSERNVVPFLVAIPSSFMEEEDDPLFLESK